MRPKKSPTVTLVVPRHDMSREFSVEHAERLLGIGEFRNGGWQLPTNSNYVYDEENGLRLKTDKRDTAKAE